MKAIQIFDINRDLLEAWGEKEELTWENSFGDLIGAVLVVDNDIPQGYSVMTHANFVERYQWRTNFGTRGWSDITRGGLSSQVPEEKNVFIVWDMNANSWTGTRTMKTIHETLAGAVSSIPENIRVESMKRELYPPYVANYTYFAVEERALLF